jgi:myo-inositol-1(or 4)-monophosphatase
MSPVKTDRLDLIGSLLRRGGNVLLEQRALKRTIVSKRSVSDLVTDADYASEEAMLDTLVSAVPDDGWLTEESGFRRGTSNRTWVIDPLDGTVNYATGLDDFGVIVGPRDRRVGVM